MDNSQPPGDAQANLKIVPYQHPGSSSPRPPTGIKRKRTKNTGSGPAKIRNACISCREKKTRCSGHEPCIRCQQQNQSCVYMPTTYSSRPSDDTSLPPNPDISPSTQGLYEEDHPSFEADRSNLTLPSDVGFSYSAENTHEALQENQYGHMHGGASEFAFLHYAKQKLANLPSMSILFSDYPLTGAGKYPPILPPKPVADELIRTYFDFGLTTSRFVHEKSLDQDYERLYCTEQGEELREDTSALIYMVMALGSHYSKPNTAFSGYVSSIRFYDMAEKQLQHSSIKITLASTQTRLLGLHYLLNHSRMHEAWSSFGIIVRHAQALGLHRKSSGPVNNHILHEYRKRLFWAIYINDRILSSVFGRPYAIHDDDIDQEECELANDEDINVEECRITEPGEFCSTAAMIHYARLAQILGRVLRKFYSPAVRQNNIAQLYEDAKMFAKQLTDWQENLPAYLDFASLPPSALSTITQRQTCTLKLTFAHISLLLYRPFILYTMGSTTNQPPGLDDWIKKCHEKAIEAAKLVVAECRFLCRRGLFSRVFWLVNYVQFAAIGTLYTYSHLWPEATHIRDIAEEAMAEFPVGVEGDLVGQRYLEVLTELREITRKSNDTAAAENSIPMEDIPLVEDFGFDLNGAWSNLFFDAAVVEAQIRGPGV